VVWRIRVPHASVVCLSIQQTSLLSRLIELTLVVMALAVQVIRSRDAEGEEGDEEKLHIAQRSEAVGVGVGVYASSPNVQHDCPCTDHVRKAKSAWLLSRSRHIR
jgi:hypothetical protein